VTLPADMYGRKVILRNLLLFVASKRIDQVVDTFRPGPELTFLLPAAETGTMGLRFTR
jgi:hypothetical protein